MTPSIAARCAAGALLLLTFGLSPSSGRVLHAAGGGTVRALVMGIDKYPNLGEASELHGAVADAQDISNALKAAGVASVRTLTNGEVVRAQVIAEMNRLVTESKAGDLVIISYSGHGMRVGAYKRWDGRNRSGVHSQIALSNFSPNLRYGNEIIVDGEMRAWYARLDAKGVDVLVVMDTCYGGRMRQVVSSSAIRIRALNTSVDEKIHDSFQPIPMNEREAGVKTDDLRHVTFFAGATETSVVPEMPGVDRSNPTATRGALSYFLSRVIDGKAAAGGDAPLKGKVSRSDLFGFLSPNVQAATEGRQFIDFGPRTESDDALEQAVFSIDEGAAGGDGQPAPTPPDPQPQKAQSAGPVRVAIVNGAKELFSTIEKGRAPFVPSEPAEADLVWDVAKGTAHARGDLLMDRVDASVLGAVIDRTWAVREIKALATPRILNVKMGENGKAYTLGDMPTLVADGIRDSYLTVVNVAADGEVQFLYPVYPTQDPHMSADQWTYTLRVDLPFGTDYAVVIATSAPATDLLAWLRAHKGKHDAYELPAVLASKIKADDKTRLGTAGLFTTPAP